MKVAYLHFFLYREIESLTSEPSLFSSLFSQYNMKAIIVICFLSAALAAPRPDGFAAQALHGSHEIDDGPAHYQFAYEIRDDRSQNFQTRHETLNGDDLSGSYSVVLPDGRLQIVNYGDDGEGFYANIKYVPQQIFTNFKIVEATPSHLSSYRSREIQDS